MKRRAYNAFGRLETVTYLVPMAVTGHEDEYSTIVSIGTLTAESENGLHGFYEGIVKQVPPQTYIYAFPLATIDNTIMILFGGGLE